MVFHFSPFLSNEHCSLKQISILTNCFHTYAIHVHIHCKLNQSNRYFGLKIESKSFPIEAAKEKKKTTRKIHFAKSVGNLKLNTYFMKAFLSKKHFLFRIPCHPSVDI